MLIPYDDERCGYCRVAKGLGKKCFCLCHVKSVNRSYHYLTREDPMTSSSKEEIEKARRKGEKFEII